MKILVLSDSHGTLRYMQEAVEEEKPDAILHLGDCQRDAERLHGLFPDIALRSVPGNCDYGSFAASPNRVEEFGGVRVFLTHGHPYGVKSGLLRAELAAREAGAQVLAFGHTHKALCKQKDGLWLVNPGSCRGFDGQTYAVILVENGKCMCYTNLNLSEMTEESHAFND